MAKSNKQNSEPKSDQAVIPKTVVKEVTVITTNFPAPPMASGMITTGNIEVMQRKRAQEIEEEEAMAKANAAKAAKGDGQEK